jgi:hypothetical protein
MRATHIASTIARACGRLPRRRLLAPRVASSPSSSWSSSSSPPRDSRAGASARPRRRRATTTRASETTPIRGAPRATAMVDAGGAIDVEKTPATPAEVAVATLLTLERDGKKFHELREHAREILAAASEAPSSSGGSPRSWFDASSSS